MQKNRSSSHARRGSSAKCGYGCLKYVVVSRLKSYGIPIVNEFAALFNGVYFVPTWILLAIHRDAYTDGDGSVCQADTSL